MQCETCTTAIASVEEAHSMLVVLQRVTPAGYAWHQCRDGSMVDGHTWQHWHCNREEMNQGVTACINEHHLESKLIHVSPLQVMLHKMVLHAGLTCKRCPQKLVNVAYRFCLTHAQPVSSVPDDSLNELGEWCCSLDHARQSALTYVH